MLRTLATHDFLEHDFLEKARVKSVLDLQCKQTYVLVEFGRIVGIAICEKRMGRFWVDRFYVRDVQKRLKSAYLLLKKALQGVGYNKKYFYGEIEKANPKYIDLFYKNSEVVSENEKIITFKRKFDVSVSI